MSVTWGSKDAEYLRKLNIVVEEELERPPDLREATTFAKFCWLALSVLSGGVLYLLLRLAAWGFRALGVHITGMP